MPLTRSFIKDAAKDAGIELPKEFVDAIIGAHVESRDAAIETAVKPLNEQLESASKSGEKDDYKTKWEDEVKAHKATKDEYALKETTGKKQAAYKALLAECKISDKRHDAIAKLADLSAIELDEKGNIKDADKIKAALTTEWAEFVETTTTKTPTVPTPPASTTNPIDALKQKYNEAEARRDVVGMQAITAQIRQIKKE